MPNDDDIGAAADDEFVEDEPIPARRDVRIFHRKKDSDKDEKDEFDEDIFV